MELDTSFLADSADAAASAPDPSVSESTPIVDPQVTPPVEPTEPVAPPVADDAGSPPSDVPPTGDEPTPDEEAEFKKLLEDPTTPKFARAKIEQAMQYAGKLKAERNSLQTEFETFRSQYEGKESLSAEDLERMRAAEERQYKLSSYTATPEEVLGSLQEVLAPQKLQAVKNQLAWDFLETPEGKPDLENLQVVIDRFSGYKEGETRVEAKDVLNAIHAMKRGTVKPYELQEFASDAEYEAYQKAQALQAQAEEYKQAQRANAEFQERATRQTVLQSVAQGVQGQFQPKVENLLNKFQLAPVENEPKVAAEFKQSVRERITSVINEQVSKNQSLVDVFKTLNMLGEPDGSRVETIQQQIQSYVNSFPYQTALSRGMSELLQAVEKTVTAEAYRYKLLMMGYQQEVSKGQNAREVIGAPKQTEVLTNYTPEQLAKMTASQRSHAILMEASNALREAEKKTSRFGG